MNRVGLGHKHDGWTAEMGYITLSCIVETGFHHISGSTIIALTLFRQNSVRAVRHCSQLLHWLGGLPPELDIFNPNTSALGRQASASIWAYPIMARIHTLQLRLDVDR